METEVPKRFKVFICWAGARSKIVAEALRTCFPRIIQAIDPFMSEDIEKGASWPKRVEEELAEAHIGIICLTKENLRAPWICFEAGALYMHLNFERVCPYLLDISPEDVQWPLATFQLTPATKDETRKLVTRINAALGEDGFSALGIDVLDDSFKTQWIRLEESLKQARTLSVKDQDHEHVERRPEEISTEILALLRNQERSATTTNSRLDRLEQLVSRVLLFSTASATPSAPSVTSEYYSALSASGHADTSNRAKYRFIPSRSARETEGMVQATPVASASPSPEPDE